MIDRVHSYLRKGKLREALDDMYQICKSNDNKYLEEIVSHTTKLELINSSDRAGLIPFEERIRMEAQVSTSLLKLLILLEKTGIGSIQTKDQLELEDLSEEVVNEKRKRILAENKLAILEKSVSNKNENLKSIQVRIRETNKRKIALTIMAISRSVSNESNYAIVLGEVAESGKRRLPIIVGSHEAQMIAIAIENMEMNRPPTLDFFKNAIETVGYSLKEVIIDELDDGIFKAKSVLISGDNHVELDCRISDAIGLAARFNSPIYIYDEILATAGVVLDEEN